MIKTDLKPEKPEPKMISVDSEDLVVMCVCRKVTMVVKGGKKDFRGVESLLPAIRDSCAIACGCKVMLMNAARQPHD
jgi:hypothetical protein